MKKLCESSLGKIEIINQKNDYIPVINQQKYYNENRDNFLSGIEGMASSIIGGTVGFIGGITWGLGKDIRGDGFTYGYKDFNERFVNPTLQNIRNSAPNEDAYDVGYVLGTVAPIATGVFGIIDKAGKYQLL